MFVWTEYQHFLTPPTTLVNPLTTNSHTHTYTNTHTYTQHKHTIAHIKDYREKEKSIFNYWYYFLFL